jgi:hypothetical protein
MCFHARMRRACWLGFALYLLCAVCLIGQALPVRADGARSSAPLEGLLGGGAAPASEGPLPRLAARLERLSVRPEAVQLAGPLLTQARAALQSALERLTAADAPAAQRALATAEAALEVVERRLARAQAEQAVREAERAAQRARARRAQAEQALAAAQAAPAAGPAPQPGSVP